MMAKEMGMQWEMKSDANGSSFYIWIDSSCSVITPETD